MFEVDVLSECWNLNLRFVVEVGNFSLMLSFEVQVKIQN